MGVRFIDSAEYLHYGWIRCDVSEEGRILTLKDYAYETKCDVGIFAGDMIGDTTTVEISEFTIDFEVYSFENSVYISFNNLNNSSWLF